MAKDTRQIALTSAELISAFEAYRKTTPHFLPSGKILRCTPSNFGSVTVTLEQRNGNATHESNFMFDAEDVLQIAIRFCIQSRIMLPRLGDKAVIITDDGVVLTVDLAIDLMPNDVVFFDVNEFASPRSARSA